MKSDKLTAIRLPLTAMNKVIQILWKLFLLTFPFSLHFVLYENATYRFGNFNPWVTGFLFLPEVFLILIFFLQTFSQLRKNNNVRDAINRVPNIIIFLFILFLLNAGVITYWQGDMGLFGFFLIHIFAGCLVYLLARKEIIPLEQTIRWLLIGALFQVILAFFQVQMNHSLGLSILGEPHLSSETLNVAKNDLSNGSKAIRGYGTFLHPNILGAYLMTILFISLPYLKKIGRIFWPLVLLGGLYLTGSQAAQLTTVFLILLFLILKLFRTIVYKKVLIFGFLTLFFTLNAWFFFNSSLVKTDYLSINERAQQNVISHDVFKAHPWGIGIGTFTLKMEELSATKLKPWDFQPVHNVYFLVLNESGIQGLVFLLGMMLLVLNNSFKRAINGSNFIFLPVLGLIVIASFDHLLWTSYMGPLLMGLALMQNRAKI